MLPTNIKHTLAIAADCYTPILLIMAIFVCVQQCRKGQYLNSIGFISLVAAVYTMMFIDKKFNLWLYFGLDYSTHTAASLALLIVIAQHKTLNVKIALYTSLIVYGELMNLLGYHSWADILSTAAFIALVTKIFFVVAEAAKKHYHQH